MDNWLIVNSAPAIGGEVGTGEVGAFLTTAIGGVEAVGFGVEAVGFGVEAGGFGVEVLDFGAIGCEV